jgi:hypothetical protein
MLCCNIGINLLFKTSNLQHIYALPTWGFFQQKYPWAGNTLFSHHVSSCDVNACSWDARGDLTLNSMVQIHTSATLLRSRYLAWGSGWLTCQHASQISAVAHISWDVTYVLSALQTLPVASRNEGNAYWKSAPSPSHLFIWHQVTRL